MASKQSEEKMVEKIRIRYPVNADGIKAMMERLSALGVATPGVAILGTPDSPQLQVSTRRDTQHPRTKTRVPLDPAPKAKPGVKIERMIFVADAQLQKAAQQLKGKAA